MDERYDYQQQLEQDKQRMDEETRFKLQEEHLEFLEHNRNELPEEQDEQG